MHDASVRKGYCRIYPPGVRPRSHHRHEYIIRSGECRSSFRYHIQFRNSGSKRYAAVQFACSFCEEEFSANRFSTGSTHSNMSHCAGTVYRNAEGCPQMIQGAGAPGRNHRPHGGGAGSESARSRNRLAERDLHDIVIAFHSSVNNIIRWH